MDIRIFKDNQELRLRRCQLIGGLVPTKPDAVLGLATGSTPIGIYRSLVEKVKQEGISFRGVTTFNLDEYVGLTPDHDQSYAYYMNQHLFSKIDIPQHQTHLPDGMAADLSGHCSAYDRMLQETGVDLQLLGLGHNGHIGFNEPAQELTPGTHVVRLNEGTRQANARFFASIDDVPARGGHDGRRVHSQGEEHPARCPGQGQGRDCEARPHRSGHDGMPCIAAADPWDVTVLLDEEAADLLDTGGTEGCTTFASAM